MTTLTVLILAFMLVTWVAVPWPEALWMLAVQGLILALFAFGSLWEHRRDRRAHEGTRDGEGE